MNLKSTKSWKAEFFDKTTISKINTSSFACADYLHAFQNTKYFSCVATAVCSQSFIMFAQGPLRPFDCFTHYICKHFIFNTYVSCDQLYG